MKYVFISVLLILIAFPGFSKSLDELTADQAYNIGKNLALHLKTDEAKRYLKYAADKGNTNAMVRYAYLSSTSDLFLSSNAYDYMLMAAKKGHEWAMISIAHQMLTSDGDQNLWRTKFLQKMQPYIDKENPDALYLMSVLEQRDEDEREDWLIKAVDVGSCEATVKLFWFYEKGDGWFLTKNRRASRVAELAKRGNQLGCLDGRGVYMSWLYNIDENTKAWEIAKSLIDDGDANVILSIGEFSFSSHGPITSIFPVSYENVSIYLKIYLEGFGKVSGLKDVYDGYLYDINRAYGKLTDKQKQYVDAYVRKYLATHDIKIEDTIWETKFN